MRLLFGTSLKKKRWFKRRLMLIYGGKFTLMLGQNAPRRECQNYLILVLTEPEQIFGDQKMRSLWNFSRSTNRSNYFTDYSSSTTGQIENPMFKALMEGKIKERLIVI